MVWSIFKKGSQSSGELRLLEEDGRSKSNGTKPNLARLPTKYFTTSDKAVSIANTYGLVRFTVEKAELYDFKKGKDAFAVVSIGQQTQVTRNKKVQSDCSVTWDAGSHFVLQKEGATVVRVAVYKEGALEGALKNTLHSYCTLDLSFFFNRHVSNNSSSDDNERNDDQQMPKIQTVTSHIANYVAAMVEDITTTPPPPTPPPPAAAAAAQTNDDNSNDNTKDTDVNDKASDVSSSNNSSKHKDRSTLMGLFYPSTKDKKAPIPSYTHHHHRHSRSHSDSQDMMMMQRQPSLTPGEMVPEGNEGSGSHWHNLVDPSDPKLVRGRALIKCQVSTLLELERQVWHRLLALADFSGNGQLNFEELETLLKALGADLTHGQLTVLFEDADKDNDGWLSVDELADLLSSHQSGQFDSLVKRCPIDGAELIPGDDYSNLIYISLCLDEGTGESLRGGYTTESEASRAWMLRTSEWVTHPIAQKRGNLYRAGGLRTGAAASYIIVYDRAAKRLVEEKLSPVLVLAMKQLYQSRMGRVMMGEGMYARLKSLSESQGKYMDSPDSLKEIKPFLKSFQGDINLDEMSEPIDSYKTFNEFFYRKLRPGARAVAEPEKGEVVVSAADCRLMTYPTVDEATRCWIKGRNFSIAGLLNDAEPNRPVAARFNGGSMAIFRLAPQDYHRFHSPVTGTIENIQDIPGQYFTVNPIAVNSKFADVFTQNKRAIMWIQTEQFGRIPFIAIGATLVGSIRWTKEAGEVVQKGEELGYFAFGGSTCIILFPPGAVVFDEDLLVNSQKSLETLVKVGERIGAKEGSEELEKGGSERHRVAELVRNVTKNFKSLPEREQEEKERKIDGENKGIMEVSQEQAMRGTSPPRFHKREDSQGQLLTAEGSLDLNRLRISISE